MKSDKRTKNELYLLLPVLAGVCWGSGGLFVRPLADAGLDLTTIIFSKSALGIPVTIIAILLTGREAFKVKAADLPAVVGAGIFGILLLSYAYNAAVLMLSLSLASILLCTAPIFVLILGRIIFGERITKTKIICMIVAFSGCGMMCGLLETGGISWSMVGIIIGIASAAGQRYVYDSFEGGHIEGIRSVYHISVFLPVYRHNIDTVYGFRGNGRLS